MIIYKATNTVNGKVYIGKTTQPFEVRYNKHKNNLNLKRYSHVIFYKAIKKYGWDAFEWEVVDHAETIEELNEKEMYWIDKCRSFVGFKNCNGYNSTLGGDGLNGWTHSEKTRVKLRKANLGKKYSEEHKQWLSEMHKQRIKDNPSVVVRGEDTSGAILTEEQVLEIIDHLKNKTHRIVELAEMYGVSRETIDCIKAGTTWSHIERDEMENYNKGSNHHSSKLTDDDVVDIKQRLIKGEKITVLAEEYGIAPQSVKKIATGQSWSHIKVKGEEVLRQETSRTHLTDDVVIQIKRLLMEDVKAVDIAKKFNISEKRVSAIKRGKTFVHVEVEGFTPSTIYKLTEDDIREIKKLINQGVSNVQIGKQFNVSDVLISMIKLGKIHADISI